MLMKSSSIVSLPFWIFYSIIDVQALAERFP